MSNIYCFKCTLTSFDFYEMVYEVINDIKFVKVIEIQLFSILNDKWPLKKLKISKNIKKVSTNKFIHFYWTIKYNINWYDKINVIIMSLLFTYL